MLPDEKPQREPRYTTRTMQNKRRFPDDFGLIKEPRRSESDFAKKRYISIIALVQVKLICTD